MSKLEGELLESAIDLYVMKAKKRILDLYYQTYGACYLSFSGGKDSTVVLALIKECEKDKSIPENSIPAVFCDTKIELDATVDFVYWVKDNWYDNVQIISTAKSFGQVIREYGKPILSKMKSKEMATVQRYRKTNENEMCKAEKRLLGIDCGSGVINRIQLGNKDLHILHKDFNIIVSHECCRQMKKIPFKTYSIEHGVEGYFIGERAAEGGARATNFAKKIKIGGNVCTRMHGRYIVKSPIVDWPDEVLERFIVKYNVPLSRAYTEYGMRRTGCYLCPFSQELYYDLKILHEKEPKKYRAALGYMKDVYIAQGLKLDFDSEYMSEFESTFPTYEKNAL